MASLLFICSIIAIIDRNLKSSNKQGFVVIVDVAQGDARLRVSVSYVRTCPTLSVLPFSRLLNI